MEPLPERTDVVVIGGGIIGVACAYRLAAAGVSVLVLERDSLGAGSTAKAAGGIRSSFTTRVNIEIGLRGLAEYASFAETYGTEIDFRRDGYLYLITDPADLPGFERCVGLQNSYGVRSRLVEPAEARRFSPLIDTEGVVAALWSPEDAKATPDSAVQGYARAARGHGAVLRTGVEVVGIERDGDEITGVRTSDGLVRTNAVVCAAGAWSGRVGEFAGVELPVRPFRRQVVFTGPVMDLPESVPLTIEMPSAFYFHREGLGLAMSFCDGDGDPGFDTRYQPGDWLPKLAEIAARRVPGVVDAGIRSGWAGLYEVTPDRNQIVGESVQVSRFFYATGFSGHGFQMGPAVGELVRDLYLGRAPSIDITELDVRRFADDRAVTREHNIV
ncbi:NAD(P)/FAD-dependent oxidoreductase [Amycolatopsis regifaucium]|uniref:Sarcosine oxidase subunit beta n=1 Tax=Amycolatopsis regifaucium TaxID=546365 RepID=A0A154MIN2_9PSEU|nr:FAD-binding oxidoreductase [Amycolatopsis regifaucium]KZB83960.1 sarcosine oxidase subunit beta [Amycolatopsis regifaucium]OKA06599.1 sarcosine oxidase subunit beta [Amycolatopsis regifaucium]SFH21376.1 sarcosine oxidase subunit beta [Amycolatopsis regifaucium]